MSMFYVPDFREEHGIIGRLKDLYVRVMGFPFYPRRVEARFVFPQMGNVRGKRVLDVGCGDGVFSLELAKRGAIVDGLDLSSDSLARSLWRAQHLGLQDRINLVLGSAENIPYGSSVFDIVLSNCVMEHIPGDELTFREVHRVLKPGGLFVITVATDFDRQKHIPLRLARAFCAMPRGLRGRIGSDALKRARTFEDYCDLVLIPYDHARFGYSESEIRSKLTRAGLTTVYLDGYMKAFGSMGQDLIEALALFKVHKSGPYGYESKNSWVYGFSFPFFYLASFVDRLLPSRSPCRGLAVVSRKG